MLKNGNESNHEPKEFNNRSQKPIAAEPAMPITHIGNSVASTREAYFVIKLVVRFRTYRLRGLINVPVAIRVETRTAIG